MRLLLTVLLCASFAPAQTLTWMGHTWKISQGHIAGVVPADPKNVSIDSTGALHMKIAKAGDTFTAAEIFTTDNLGFGTYQWQLDGSQIYAMDPTIVLGLFSYGPTHHIGADAEEEIDIEFSQWNHTTPKPVNADFTVYPPTGFRRPNGVSAWEDNFDVPTHPEQTTARFVWSREKIEFYIMAGFVPITAPPDHILKHDTLVSDGTNVPHVALPIGINLWSFKQPPQHEWDIVVRRFDYQPAPVSH